MKFLLDACAGGRLADWLQEQGHDVSQTRDRGTDPGDESVLAWAVREGRILVTIDKDFGRLIRLSIQQHRGILRLPDVPSARRITLVKDVLERHQGDLENGAIVTVRGDRIRISQ